MIPQRLEHQATDKGYVPIYATGVVEQPWHDYSDTDHAVWSELYARQREVLLHLAAGKLNKQIAYELGLSERTVKMHRAAVFTALGVRTGADAIRLAIEAGY